MENMKSSQVIVLSIVNIGPHVKEVRCTFAEDCFVVLIQQIFVKLKGASAVVVLHSSIERCN